MIGLCNVPFGFSLIPTVVLVVLCTMGKATRWLKSLFGLKKEKEQPNSGDRKQSKWYSPGHSGRESVALCHNPATIPPNLSPAEAAWIRSCYTEETEKEQNKHAIAVAAATAAAADAAVAAAQAAVAVVRLTSHGRGTMFGGGGRERFAAVKIQNVFRGYLARKALRALKGLVKLQALVRGYLVRKQAAATLYSMQALIRAQSTVRSQKFRSRINNNNNNNSRFNSEFRARKSTERFDESKSEHQHTASFHSRRLSAASFDAFNNNGESPKIVEVDNGRPKSSRSRRRNNSTDFGDDPFYQTISSPFPCQIPATNRLSTIPDCHHRRNFQDPDWGLTSDECKFSTAHSTPRFRNSSSPNPLVPAPVTPAKSVCIDSFFRGHQFSNCHPNYMSNTQSFKAKLRSYSAPKQRPEPETMTPSTAKKRVSLTEMMESTRSSLSGVRMQRSCSHVQEAISFKNAVMGKLDRSSDCVREDEPEREQRHYLPRRW